MQPISNDRKSPYRCGQVRKDPNLTPAGFTRKPVSVQLQVDLSDVVSPSCFTLVCMKYLCDSVVPTEHVFLSHLWVS